MPPYHRYSVTMEILSFPFLFARKFSSMRTHFAPCLWDTLSLPLRKKPFKTWSRLRPDRWKAEDFEFHFAYNARYESRYQRGCSKSYFSQLKFLRLILKRWRARNRIKISISWSNPITLLFTPKENLYNSQIVVKFMNKKLIYYGYR